MLASGTRVERWVVEGLLGRGGMAEVYAVRHTVLGTPGALKVLAIRSGDLVERLLREGRAQGGLQHPNVVAVTDVLEVDGAPALLMERVSGPSLAELIAQGPLDPERVARLAEGLLAGLDAAHRAGIVHRDLKPSNVLIAPGDVPRITDFGLARALAHDPSDALTATGAVLGTAAYMSPEQIRDARRADPRSDLYALGAMLYELLTGKAPARGLDTIAAWQRASTRDFPRPSHDVEGVPPELDHAVWWALEPDPVNRPASARAMYEAVTGRTLPSAAVHATPSAAPARAPSRSTGAPPPRSSRPLVGRDELLDAVYDRLDARGGWVTLTGTGGAGKTHLAAELARTWTQRGGQTRWIDLQPARHGEDLERTLSWALEVDPTSGPDGIPRALAALGRALVVLDNLEQLSQEACQRLADWTSAAPSLRLLVTSRRPLQVPDEETFEVVPFEVPDPEHVFASAAWGLLRASAPPSALAGVDASDVVTLLRALDGLPLAIELAAARLEVLGFPELVRRLEDRFAVLTDPETPGTRHGALYDTIAWSWALLGPAEQDTLAQATTFRAPFALDAAEAVVSPSEGAVLDALHVLVRRHLVVREGSRFRLLESIRDFARQQLDDPTRLAAWRRHARWLAVRAERRRSAPTNPESVRESMADAPETLAVLHRLDQDPTLAGDALAAGCSLLWTLIVRGPAQETRRVADGVLAATPDVDMDDPGIAFHLCNVLLSRGQVRRRTGDLDGAAQDLDRALELARRSHSDAAIGSALAHLADLVELRGDAERAEALYLEALPLLERSNSYNVVATTHTQLAAILFDRGEHRLALERTQLALESLPAGSDLTELEIRKSQGWMALGMEDAALGEEAFSRAEVLAEALGDTRATGYVASQRGLLAEGVTGDLEVAEQKYRESLQVMQDEGDPLQQGYILGFLGRTLYRRSRPDEAEDALVAALHKLSTVSEAHFSQMFRVALSAVRARRGGPSVLEATDAPEGGLVVEALQQGWDAVQAGDLAAAGAASELAAERLGTALTDTAVKAVLRHAIAELTEQSRSWGIAEDGTWVQPPDGPRVDLSRSEANARILASLAAARMATPGVGADVDALVEAGWPGQRIVAKAGANRVRVALSALRKAGLADLIQRGSDGWYLDPEVPVRLVATSPS